MEGVGYERFFEHAWWKLEKIKELLDQPSVFNSRVRQEDIQI